MDSHKMSDIIKTTIKCIEENYLPDTSDAMLVTGFTSLDQMVSFEKHNLITIAAPPDEGKTSFALNILNLLGNKRKIPCSFISYKNTPVEICTRLIAIDTQLKRFSIRNGFLKGSDFDLITDTAAGFYSSPIYIKSTPKMSMDKIEKYLTYMVQNNGIQIAFIDDVTSIPSVKPNFQKWESMVEIARRLKVLAMELSIPVVVLTHINKKDKSLEYYTLDDFSYSDSVASYSDLILVLDKKDECDEYEKNRDMIVSVIKNNDYGILGSIHFSFEPAIGIYREKND